MKNYESVKKEVDAVLFKIDVTEIYTFRVNGKVYQFCERNGKHMLQFSILNDTPLFNSVIKEIIHIIEKYGFKTDVVCKDILQKRSIYKFAEISFI
jgi:hypothetical protein